MLIYRNTKIDDVPSSDISELTGFGGYHSFNPKNLSRGIDHNQFRIDYDHIRASEQSLNRSSILNVNLFGINYRNGILFLFGMNYSHEYWENNRRME